MSFIRAKRINSTLYYYQVQNERVAGKKYPKQTILNYLGDFDEALKKIKQFKIGTEEKEIFIRRIRELEGRPDSDCWMTPDTEEQPILTLVEQVFGGQIGLDPTADLDKRVRGLHHFTVMDNCLIQSWKGLGATFMNPKFSKPQPFVEKFVEEYEIGHIPQGIMLLRSGALSNKGTGAVIERAYTASCLWRGRIAYINPQTGQPVIGADFDSALVYFGENVSEFASTFNPYGTISVPHRSASSNS